MTQQTPAAVITSFGYGHAPAPTADIVIDARRRFRNPHHDPAMRELTGRQEAVRSHVLATPGVTAIVCQTALLAAELAETTADDRPVSVAIGCVGGRHRSVAMAEAIADELERAGLRIDLVHRDVHRPVIQNHPAPDAPAPTLAARVTRWLARWRRRCSTCRTCGGTGSYWNTYVKDYWLCDCPTGIALAANHR
ncbi:RNase adapter RapZ [Planomonospora sp. ID82291]|uniref:RapZ C-terminal domain-containing protein n=1 Tax=Planomonospora sp. ID82291 TaxID=2738136 RepID=UPI0018C44066|nr:RNase adapter RapZ [Planomonospora sp. ID82291]